MPTNRKKPSLDDVCILIDARYEFDEYRNQIEVEPERTEIFCGYTDLYRNEFYKAAVQDLKVSMVLIIDAESYNGEKKLEYDGIEYTIIRTYEREDGLLEVTCGEK